MFKMASKHGGLLSDLPKHKKTVMWLTEKTHMLDKPCLGMGYSGFGCDFRVNESTYIT